MVAPLVAAALSPVLAELFKNGLTMLGNAVQAKGKQVIEEKLGVDLTDNVATQEGLYKLRAIELEHQEFLISADIERAELALKEQTLDNQDRASARDMNTRVNDSPNASWLSKNIAAVIALIIVVTGLLIMYYTPHESVRTAIVGLITMILSFYFGSTSSSKSKDDTIKAMSESK
jgi:uncharacterized protein YacL